MKRTFILVIFALIACCAFGQTPAQQALTMPAPGQQPATTTPPSQAAEDAVYQAVALYQISRGRWAGMPIASA